MTTQTKTPIEIAQLELAVIVAGVDQLTSSYEQSRDAQTASYEASAAIALANYNVQLARRNNEKAAKEAQIASLQEAADLS